MSGRALAVATGWRILCSGNYVDEEDLEKYSTSVALGSSVTSWKALFHCCSDSGSKIGTGYGNTMKDKADTAFRGSVDSQQKIGFFIFFLADFGRSKIEVNKAAKEDSIYLESLHIKAMFKVRHAA